MKFQEVAEFPLDIFEFVVNGKRDIPLFTLIA
jgi:hypothetical protein